MNYKNRKIIIVSSCIIGLIVLAIIFFDLNLYVKAFLGTVVLGLLCFMRALTSAVEILENEVENEEQVEDKLSGEGSDVYSHDTEEHLEPHEEDSTCTFSASSDEFIEHMRKISKSQH